MALGAILLLAAVLRLAWLGELPAGLSHDEAVKGYDAWSILHTGRDQYGSRLPLVFRALGDQREAVLPYAIVLSEAVLGPTDFAVRLPTALAGIALVAAIFALGRELYGSRVGLLAALFLACSPWHVQVSRLAFRAGLLPLTTVAGLWLLLMALRRPRLMVAAGATLGLGLHTYLAARPFVPLLVLGLIVIYRDALLPAQAITGSRLRGLWSRPLVPLLAGVALMTLPLAIWAVLHPAEFAGHAAASVGSGSLAQQATDVIRRYVVYFGPRHLLTQGDPYPVPSTGRFGALYWPLLPCLLVGVFQLMRRRGRGDLLLLWWLAAAPVAAASTRGGHPDWLRASAGIGALDLIAAGGAATILTASTGWLRATLSPRTARRAGGVGMAVAALLYAASIGWFLYDYALRFPDRAAPAFHDGVAAAMRQLTQFEGGYARVVLPADVPAVHDLYLFYSRYDPRRLHAEGLEDVAPAGAWAEVRGFGNHRICDPVRCCRAGDLCLVRGAWQGDGRPLIVIHDRAGRPAFTIIAGDALSEPAD